MIHFKPFRFGRAEKWYLVAIIGLIGLTIGVMTISSVAHGYSRATETWTNIALRYGYFGAFFSAFIGSISLVIVFPYTIIIFFLATRGLDPFALGVLMGLGAAIGQMTGYLVGLWGAHYVEKKKPETYDALERIVNYRPVMVQWLLFVFAVTPLPDTVILVPLGILRYSWWRVVFPTLAGKIVSGLIVTYSSRTIGHLVAIPTTASLTALVGQVGTLAIVATIIYLFFKLDWQRMMHRLIDRHAPSVSKDSSV